MRQEDELRIDLYKAMRLITAVLANASGNLKKPAKPEDVMPLPGDKPRNNGFRAMRRNG